MTSRNSVMPLILVVLAAGTAAYAYFVDRKGVSDTDREARHGEVFPSFRREDVTRVALEHGNQALVLERALDAGGAPWTMAAPPLGGTEAAAVDALLRELESARRLRTVDPGNARGLENPRAMGTLSLGSMSYRFALGDDAPIPAGAAYLRVDGEGTFVVDASLVHELMKGPEAYRDRRLWPGSAGDVGRVEVRSSGGTGYAVVRHAGTFWLASPSVRASRTAVEALVEGLAGARVDAFVDDAVADRTTAVATRITIEGARAPSLSVELRVGGACPTQADAVVVVRTEPGRLSGCTRLSIPESGGGMHDDDALWAHADEVEELRVEPLDSGAPPLDVARRGSGWRERAPHDHDLSADEATRVTDLLTELTGAHGSLATGVDGGPPFPARTRITVVRTGGEWTEQVELGPREADGSSLLRRSEDGAVLRLLPDVATRLAGILRAM